jgi:hypothetical protein
MFLEEELIEKFVTNSELDVNMKEKLGEGRFSSSYDDDDNDNDSSVSFDVDINGRKSECSPNPCFNSGVCTEDIDGIFLKCICLPDYIGAFCESHEMSKKRL